MNRFDVWFKEEGNDMLPCKEALEVAWKNGEYVAREDFESRTCEYCIHINGDFSCDRINHTNVYVDVGFGCNKWEKQK